MLVYQRVQPPASFCFLRHFFLTWQCVKTLYPCSSHQNSWVKIDVHPTKNGINRYWSIHTLGADVCLSTCHCTFRPSRSILLKFTGFRGFFRRKHVGAKLPGVTLRREMPCWCTQKDCSPCPSHVLNWQKQQSYVWHVALMAADADIFPWSTGKQGWFTTTSDRCRPLICARRHPWVCRLGSWPLNVYFICVWWYYILFFIYIRIYLWKLFYLYIYWFVYQSIHLCIHSFIHSFIYSFMHACMHACMHSFIHSFHSFHFIHLYTLYHTTSHYITLLYDGVNGMKENCGGSHPYEPFLTEIPCISQNWEDFRFDQSISLQPTCEGNHQSSLAIGPTNIVQAIMSWASSRHQKPSCQRMNGIQFHSALISDSGPVP